MEITPGYDHSEAILILGGYGNVGVEIASLLVSETTARVIVAGRDLARAEATAEQLNKGVSSARVSGIRVDAADRASLDLAMTGVDLVVVASSTMAFVEQVATACLDNRCDYLDTQLSGGRKIHVLKRLALKIQEADLCFITDGGYHPGLPAAMVAYAATQIDRLESGNVFGCIALDWASYSFSKSTQEEFVEELQGMRQRFYADGSWVEGSYRDMKSCDFGRFGSKKCIPLHMEEMEALPGLIPSLRDVGFFIAGFNPIVDYLAMPLTMMGIRALPRRVHGPLMRFFTWSLQKTSKPPFGCTVQLDARGLHHGSRVAQTVRVFHEDGYIITAAPVVACLLQVLDGTARKSGVHTQANIIEPRRFMGDLDRMGIEIEKPESWDYACD